MSRHNVRFEDRLEQIQQFCAENGHGWIPARYDTDPQTGFGFWANTVRFKSGKGTLPQQREDQLRAAGFLFLRTGMDSSVRVKNLQVIDASRGGHVAGL